jgi:ATP-dependent Clp protease ATP-binding subunit ClpA
MRLHPDLQVAIDLALLLARKRRHELAGIEHLLLALLHDPRCAAALRICGARPELMRQELERYLDQEIEALPEGTQADEAPAPTKGFERVVRRAALQARNAGKDEVEAAGVLVAFFEEKDAHARYLLEKHGVGRLELVGAISHAPELAREGPEAEGEAVPSDPLEQWTVDLVARAARGEIDPLVGREEEILRVGHVLARRRKSNPLLVGEPGVGKTALVEGLALRIHEGKVPALLQGLTLLLLDAGALLAGTRYRGDFEARVKAVLRALQAREGAVLVVDDIHLLMGAGATGGGAMDASNLLKPALGSGALRCIGVTTQADYRAMAEKDRGLLRRFQKIEVEEPPRAELVAILQGVAPAYARFHGVTYSEAALEAAVDLAARHLRERQNPDAALDLLDEAGAAERLAGRETHLDRADIEAHVARIAGVPTEDLREADRVGLLHLEARLKAVIFGQDAAVDRLVACVRMARAGLRAPEKPLGSFLLTGPTGVGKTELARQLAATLHLPLHRFDMSEYNERHTVSRLVGAPPGYVGFEREGLLSGAVARTPHCVVLLDEVEKACPEVFNLLLQVMDHGVLTDAHGRKADFRQVFLLMTSNVGARDIAQRGVGFSGEIQTGAEDRAMRETFSPEFRNRLDARLSFATLGPEIMGRIVDKLVDEIAVLVRPRGITLTLAPEARAILARRGHDPAFGARHLARLLEEELKKPLAEAILFGGLDAGGNARVEAESASGLRLVYPTRGPTEN